MLAGDEEGHLTSVDHDPLDGLPVRRAAADKGTLQTVGDLVVVPAVGTHGRSREEHGRHQAAIPAGISAVGDTEHPLSRADDHGLRIRPGGRREIVSCVAHARRPFMSCVGMAASAAASAAWAAATRLTPSGVFWICSCNVMIALSSISGRGGPVSYTHLRAHETGRNLVCRLLLEKKKTT